MQITLERSNLLKSLNHVSRIVERRNIIPILSNVLFQASDQVLTMKATDLELEITETTVADVQKPGSATIPAQLLYDIVRKLPDGSEITLSKIGSTVTVISGSSKFSLQCLSETEFPNLKEEVLTIL